MRLSAVKPTRTLLALGATLAVGLTLAGCGQSNTPAAGSTATDGSTAGVATPAPTASGGSGGNATFSPSDSKGTEGATGLLASDEPGETTCWQRTGQKDGGVVYDHNTDDTNVGGSYACFTTEGRFSWYWAGAQDENLVEGTWASNGAGKYTLTRDDGGDAVDATIVDDMLVMSLSNGNPYDVFTQYGPCQDPDACGE